MKTKAELKLASKIDNLNLSKPLYSIQEAVLNSYFKIAPLWPLKNFIAVNPLKGFQNLPFEEALRQAKAYFQNKELPQKMESVNRESIKWLQVFFDSGQSTIHMPLRHLGFFKSIFSLLPFDKSLKLKQTKKRDWLEKLPDDYESIVTACLNYLKIPSYEHELFLTLMLTTLPGWAAYIQYRTSWPDDEDSKNPHAITQIEYLAFRLVLTCLIYPDAKELILWHKKALNAADTSEIYSQIEHNEKAYQSNLFLKLKSIKKPQRNKNVDAQIVFCIDVRSEPFRRALENQGRYETFGFAGFFGLPVYIENEITGEKHASCPVLLQPSHKVVEKTHHKDQAHKKGYKKLKGLKKIYQSLKYTFTTPFALVETLGMASGFWMGLRSFSPHGSKFIESIVKKSIAPNYSLKPEICSIPFESQVNIAATVLKMIGLTENFAPLVIFCGHGSQTENNAYASALNCGACGGHKGAPNARILASILNDSKVRKEIERTNQIIIPHETLFLAAEHNTTTDKVEIFKSIYPHSFGKKIQALENDLEQAREANSFWRCLEMGVKVAPGKAKKATATRSQDWAQIRPEWGLARNAAFIIGPRWATESLDLQGRSFLHSYDWEKDFDASLLKGILNGPMIVTQWINLQYFFSTLDNVAFGSGSKATKNVAGKIGIMQGNASDLLHGLPLQSVNKKDLEPYHQPIRLTVILYAPKSYIDSILKEDVDLKTIFAHGWLHFICYDLSMQKKFQLQRDLSWEELKL